MYGIHTFYFTKTPTCFDTVQNGIERGVDCGGACTRICSFTIIQPKVLWVLPFRVTDGLYNAVAYIENRNLNVGAPNLAYTLSLYDNKGLIAQVKDKTVLPPDSTYPIFVGRIATDERVPTHATIDLETDTLWLPAKAGREQFQVTGRDLKSVDTRPRLTVGLKNTSLDEAKDVEVIATIFDAHGNALTASKTVIPYFEARSTKDITFTWQEPITKTLRSCEVPTDVILAIDLSGSMNEDGGNPPEPVTSVLTAARSFVTRLSPQDQGGVVTYATEAVNQQGLTSNHDALGSLISGLTIKKADETGSTNTGDALIRAGEEFTSDRHNQDARKVLVLLTDGLANAPGKTPTVYAVDAATALKKTGVEIFTIGLGKKLDSTFLMSIATDEKHSFVAPEADTVGNIYQSITSAICEDGAAVIEIIPKTSASFTPLR